MPRSHGKYWPAKEFLLKMMQPRSSYLMHLGRPQSAPRETTKKIVKTSVEFVLEVNHGPWCRCFSFDVVVVGGGVVGVVAVDAYFLYLVRRENC